MAWRRPGDKPLCEPMMVRLPTHICVARPQWVDYVPASCISVSPITCGQWCGRKPDISCGDGRSLLAVKLPLSTGILPVSRDTDISESSGGRFKNTYELLNLRALKISKLHKNHILQCMGKIFCVEFQRFPLKFHTKYLTHTLKDVDFIHIWKFKSSLI